jgi:hypothetical protein
MTTVAIFDTTLTKVPDKYIITANLKGVAPFTCEESAVNYKENELSKLGLFGFIF